MDQVEEILSKLPPASVNNARAIVMEAVRDFEEAPTDKKRHRLEELGFSVDHDDYLDHRHDIERH